MSGPTNETSRRTRRARAPATGETSEATSPRRGSALDKALGLLGCFSQERAEVGVTEAARLVGVDKGTASRLLRQLADAGYLETDGNGYRLGWRIGELGAIRSASIQSGTAVPAAVSALARQTGNTVQFAIYNQQLHRAVITFAVEGFRRARVAASVGSVVPLHATSVGRAMCSAMNADQLTQALAACDWARYTDSTITDRDALLHAVDQTRKQGFAVVVGEYFPDQYAVAAPVVDAAGMYGALAILAVPGDLREPADETRAGRITVEAARSLARAAAGGALP